MWYAPSLVACSPLHRIVGKPTMVVVAVQGPLLSHFLLIVFIGRSCGGEKKIEMAYLLVLAHRHRSRVTGCHGRQKKSGIAVVVTQFNQPHRPPPLPATTTAAIDAAAGKHPDDPNHHRPITTPHPSVSQERWRQWCALPPPASRKFLL